MKSRLIILSDLWGKEKDDWIRSYQKYLEPEFDIQYYDCCELGNVDTANLNEKEIHSQFIATGIDTAVRTLIESEINKVSLLAFSIGSTIAWKAGLEGLRIDHLYGISSTRLRYEVKKPDCAIKLYYGKKDNYAPTSKWFNDLSIEYEIIKNGDHLIYRDMSFSKKVCQEIKIHSQKPL